MDEAERTKKSNDDQDLRQPEYAIENAEYMAESLNIPAGAPLPEGSVVLQGKYQLLHLLHRRPRVNLYLARRLPGVAQTPVPHAETPKNTLAEAEPLVAIRELVLSGLPLSTRKQIERAAFEEFVSPAMLGSPRLPGAGDRVRGEGERHYLVMQLRRARGGQQAVAVTLAELLLSRKQWPSWLDMQTALEWGVQLCRIVARLHRLGVVLGDLNPTIVLVDREGAGEWAPVLLISWPPAPQFWPAFSLGSSVSDLYESIFPPAELSAEQAFAAPEMLNGIRDARSDVYSLGALLYLLLTRYAPAAAALRQRAEGIDLIPPHLFNDRIPAVLEKIVLRALALDLGERYSSVFALVEALESVDLQKELSEASTEKYGTPKVSGITRMMEWLRQELSE